MTTLLNLQSIPSRLGSSSVMIIGIAGVVGVLVSILTMATGLSSTLLASGRPDRAIVLHGGANGEAASGLARDSLGIIENAPGVARTPQGRSAVSIDIVTALNLPRKSDGTLAAVTLRGLSEDAFFVRSEVRVVDGRMFSRGVRELIVGRGAQSQFQGLEVGNEVDLLGGRWIIVGTFQSDNSHESGFLTDLDTLMSAYQRNWVNSVTVLLDSPLAFDEFQSSLMANPTLSVDVMREPDYFEQQSRAVSALLFFVTYVIGTIMAVGAMFAALNTMYSAVSQRTKETAILRAMGFGAGSVTVSVLLEALCLAGVGGLLGASIAWLFFGGNTISLGTLVGSVVTELQVTPRLLATGIIWACSVGLLGGLLPAMRAARLPVVVGLRSE
jgi:putative ABC transport system permease protein